MTTNRNTRAGGLARISSSLQRTLRIPVEAAKEFDKANELVAKQDLTHAIERLQQSA